MRENRVGESERRQDSGDDAGGSGGFAGGGMRARVGRWGCDRQRFIVIIIIIIITKTE